jgi:DNA-binding MarR family transcriptional regulator
MLISSGGLTKLLKGLDARGLVLRLPSAGDARSRPVELSDEGSALIERAMTVGQAAERR